MNVDGELEGQKAQRLSPEPVALRVEQGLAE